MGCAGGTNNHGNSYLRNDDDEDENNEDNYGDEEDNYQSTWFDDNVKVVREVGKWEPLDLRLSKELFLK